MTRKQRMLAVLRGEKTDMVPFATYNLHGFGDSPHRDDPSYAELLELVRERAGLYCKSTLTRVAREDDSRSIEQTEETDPHGNRRLTTVLHTPRGDLTSVHIVPVDQPGYTVEHFMKTDDDIDRYLSLPREPAEFDDGGFSDMEGEVGERGIVTIGYDDPMYAAAQLFDFEDFTIRCITDRAAIRRLVEHLFELIAEETKRMAQAVSGRPVAFLTSGPEVATTPMMPPEVFGALVLPYQKKLIETIHGAGHLAIIHCHGHVREVLDYMIETGADATEPIEPPPQGNIELSELLERTSGRMAVMGHIQDQELHYASPGEMRGRVEEIARTVAGRSGYIMSPTCTPFQHPVKPTFLANYAEWVRAASEVFGRP